MNTIYFPNQKSVVRVAESLECSAVEHLRQCQGHWKVDGMGSNPALYEALTQLW